jgi:alanine dehydrogenase
MPAKVLIIGGGIVGTEAAKMAAGLGADITIMDVSLKRLRYLDDIMPANVKTRMSNDYNIREMVRTHDLIIGAVLIPGTKAPHLGYTRHAENHAPRNCVVDVAVDQGGCFETTIGNNTY